MTALVSIRGGAQMDRPLKRGPAFKTHLIPSILNCNRDNLPVDPYRPYKWQTRRLTKPAWKEGDDVVLLEPFRLGRWYPGHPIVEVRYKAGDAARWAHPSSHTLKNLSTWKRPAQIKPGRYMPTEFSRMTAQVLEVRQEPLQSITAEDAIAEGIDFRVIENRMLWRDYMNDHYRAAGPVCSFKSLWESIHGPDAWEENPDVWVTAWSLKSVALASRGELLVAAQ